jgi:hypothetical protein
MAGPGDEIAAAESRSRDDPRASHADREQVIGTLKTAFVQGRLTEDELDARVDQVYASRTYAELNAVTADIPGAPRLDGLPVLARRWPLAMAAVKSGGFLAMAFVIAVSGNMIDNSDPNGTGPGPHHGWTRLLLSLSLTFVITALAILGHGVAASVEQRRSRKQLPPRPGPGGQALDAALHGGAGNDLVPPGPTTEFRRRRYAWSPTSKASPRCPRVCRRGRGARPFSPSPISPSQGSSTATGYWRTWIRARA